MKPESQALKISVASIPARQKGCFRIDSQILKTPSTSTGASDANICNPGCKYLQPHLQTLSSQNSYVHLLRKEPSPTPIFMSWRPYSRTHPRPKQEIPHPHRRTFGRILSHFFAVKSMNFLHKREQMCNVPLSFERKSSTTGSVILTPQMPFQRHITTAQLQLNNPKSIPFCPQLTIY